MWLCKHGLSVNLRDETVLADLQSFESELQAASPLLPWNGKLFFAYFIFIKKYSFLRVGTKDSSCSYEPDKFNSEERVADSS